ncbi:MAG: STAS domain-containing protein [Roseiflexaceae bacterium]
MRFTQRNVTLAILVLLMVVSWLVVGYQLLVIRDSFEDLQVTLISSIVITGLMVAYWYRWEPARYLLIICVTLAAGLGIDATAVPNVAILVPSALAVILGTPVWVIASGIGVYAIATVRSDFHENYTNPILFLIYMLIVVAIVLGRFVTESMSQMAAVNAQQAEQNARHAQEQAAQLEQANQQLSQQLEQQQRLIELVATLETPAVVLADGVLFAPIIGNLDTRRSKDLTVRLLEKVHTQRTKMVVLDVAGVAIIDTTVAQALINTATALRLLGCQVAISGISPEVALTLTRQNISLAGIITVRNPQEALATLMATRATTAFTDN